MPFKRDNPYGILILAIPFIVGGIILLVTREPGIFVASPVPRVPDANFSDVETASVTMEHAAGLVGLIIGGIIIRIYFKVRNG